MKIPVVRGIIDRRILVNFRVDPEALARVLPSPFLPKKHRDRGIAGVCLIRLKGVRPRWAPRFLGITSENAAHRIAVEWESSGETREGVFIPRRDTSCGFNVLLGGRAFPGEHHRADFRVNEREESYSVEMRARDGSARVAVEGTVAGAPPEASVFSSVDEASAFFERGSLGYSATQTPGRFDGLELRTDDWKVEPLAVSRVESSFFDDPDRFPAGSVTFDHALLMRNIRHEWHGRDTLYGPCCTPASGA